MTGYNLRMKSLWQSYKNYIRFNQTNLESHKLLHDTPIEHRKSVEDLVQQGDKSHEALPGHGHVKSPTGHHKQSAGNLAADGHGSDGVIAPTDRLNVKGHVSEDKSGAQRFNETLVIGQIVDTRNNLEERNADTGRKLLSYNEANVNIHEMDMNVNDIDANENELDDGSYVSPVDIQPDTVKLLPWERGSLADLQKVCE